MHRFLLLLSMYCSSNKFQLINKHTQTKKNATYSIKEGLSIFNCIAIRTKLNSILLINKEEEKNEMKEFNSLDL